MIKGGRYRLRSKLNHDEVKCLGLEAAEGCDITGFLQDIAASQIEFLKKSTHSRPAMPFGNRKIHFRGSFQFSIVTV